MKAHAIQRRSFFRSVLSTNRKHIHSKVSRSTATIARGITEMVPMELERRQLMSDTYGSYWLDESGSTVTGEMQPSTCSCQANSVSASNGKASATFPAPTSAFGGVQFDSAEAIVNGYVAGESGTGTDGGSNTVSMGVAKLSSDASGNMVVVMGPTEQLWFSPSGTNYSEFYGGNDKLTSNAVSNPTVFTLTETDGTKITFNGLDSPVQAAMQGDPISEISPGGNLHTTFNYDSSGHLLTVTRNTSVGTVVTEEQFRYSYLGGGDPNAGKISSIALGQITFDTNLGQTDTSQPWVPVQTGVYS